MTPSSDLLFGTDGIPQRLMFESGPTLTPLAVATMYALGGRADQDRAALRRIREALLRYLQTLLKKGVRE